MQEKPTENSPNTWQDSFEESGQSQEADFLFHELSYHDVPAIPFICYKYNPQTGYGRNVNEGIIRLEQNKLILEFEQNKNFWENNTWENFFGLFTQPAEKRVKEIITIELPLTEIEFMDMKRGFFAGKETFFRNSIVVQVKKLNLLSRMPASKMGKVRLLIPKDHRTDAEKLVSRAMLIRSELKIKNDPNRLS